jgi:hypothetical protein
VAIVDGSKRQPGGDVTLTLSYAEAVVLADMLWRWERDGTQERIPIEDQAEQRILWDLTALFEPLIDEVVGGPYDSVVAHSRSIVRDSNGR